MEIVRNGMEDVGDARRYGVVIGRILAAADGEDCGDFRSRDGCSLLRDAEEGNELVIDRHVPPEEAWYVIPVEAFAPHLHLWLYPRGEHAGQYEKYREAWELLGAGVRS